MRVQVKNYSMVRQLTHCSFGVTRVDVLIECNWLSVEVLIHLSKLFRWHSSTLRPRCRLHDQTYIILNDNKLTPPKKKRLSIDSLRIA